MMDLESHGVPIIHMDGQQNSIAFQTRLFQGSYFGSRALDASVSRPISIFQGLTMAMIWVDFKRRYHQIICALFCHFSRFLQIGKKYLSPLDLVLI